METEVLLANNLTAVLELPNDWPIGDYTAQVYVDENLLTTIEYSVQ